MPKFPSEVKTQVIIPAAGAGTRLNLPLPKPFVKINGRPLCAYTMAAFEECPLVDSVILVGHNDQIAHFKKVVRQYGFKKVVKIIAGGKTRRQSVARGLAMLDEDTELVVVHDGARPVVSPRIIQQAIGLCRNWPAVAVGVPVASTIKKVNTKDLFIEETLDRDGLWEIQTPQVFQKNAILKAHQQNISDSATDDAVLVERLGIKVKVLLGDYKNIKVTTTADLTIAESFLKG